MLKPLGDRILVSLEKTEEKTASGLVLAGNLQEKTQLAKVVAVGTGALTLTGEKVAPTVAVGDQVLLESQTGIAIKDAGQDYVLVREADILAIVTA